MADDLQRLLGRDCRPHRLFDVTSVAYFQDIHLSLAFASIVPDGAPSVTRRSPASSVLKTWRPDTRATNAASRQPPCCAAHRCAPAAPLPHRRASHNSTITELSAR